MHEECWTDGYQDNVTPELLAEQATTSLAIRAIRSATPADAQAALEARDKRIRGEALRDALQICFEADRLDDAERQILALLKEEQTDE